MLARVAGNLFWLNRYLERAEGTTRLINEHSRMLMDLPDTDPATAWFPLVSITGVDEQFSSHFNEVNEDTVTTFLISDERNPSSIVSALNAVRYNLRSSRDIMPSALYESINNLCLMTRSEAGNRMNPAARQTFLNTVQHQLLAISGLTEGSMSHDQAYLFLRMGCRLERADMTSRILDVRSANLMPMADGSKQLSFENHQWVSVLKSLAAFQMYLSHVRKPINGRDVLNYLLNDNKLPRACRCCLLDLESCLKQLPDSDKPRSLLQSLQASIDATSITELTNDQAVLHTYIDDLQLALAGVGDAIAARYFPPTES